MSMAKRGEDLNEMLRLAFEASPAAMFMVDQSGRIEMVNGECEEIFGFERGEMVGMSVETLIPAGLRPKHKTLRNDFIAKPSKRLMGVGRDLRALRRDGSEFPVEIGLTPVATPLGMRVVAFAIDITARLETEKSLKTSMAELERANASLSRFAYVASHDIQEPLRKIAAFADILRTAMAQNDPEEARYAANVMSSSAQHARRMVADVLALARSLNSAYALETIFLRETIDTVLDNLSLTIAEKSADIAVSGDDFSIEGDKSQVAQMVQNLVSNALKYHKPNQSPQIRIALIQQADENSLAIEDDGIGFSNAHSDDIFQPFRRLHDRNDVPGTGIGLAICKAIASRHGWLISATSTPIAGSTFRIVFPRKAGEAAAPG
jgi:PAS domain S-box-containing protein